MHASLMLLSKLPTTQPETGVHDATRHSGISEAPSIPALPSTQLNIVTLIDVAGTLRAGSVTGNTGLMDNGGESTGKGTNTLRTVCRQGQVLNWLVYCTDMEKRPDGSWPFSRAS